MTAPQPTAFIQGQGTVSADNLNTFVQTVTNVPQLRTVIGLPGMQIILEGYTTQGDGGGGVFYWNVTSTGPDNGTTVIVPQPGVAGAWIRNTSSTLPLVVGTATQFTPPWGFSPSIPVGFTYLGYTDTVTGGGTALQPSLEPMSWISRTWNITTNLSYDFTGAPGASAPLFYIQSETEGGSNLQAHNIMSYIINNGSQDAVAVSGRVIREQCTLPNTGYQECAGYYGSAFNYSNNPGATIGVEAVIFNDISGTVASDFVSINNVNGFTTAIHASTISSGSPSNCILLMDGNNSAGYYGTWNGIIMDSSIWTGAALAGTVGINMGSWNDGNNGYYPYTGLKFGTATQHIWFNDFANNGVINCGSGALQIYSRAVPTAVGSCGVQIISESGFNSFLDFYQGSTHSGNIAWNNGTNSFDVNEPGLTNTRINPSGGLVYMASTINGYGFTFGASAATDGYFKIYRASSTATNGVIDVYSDVTATNTNQFRVQANGNVLNINNSYGMLSDERLKENIVDARGYLDDLNKLKVRKFSLKSAHLDKPNLLGLIAQETAPIFPGLVETDENGIMSMKYSVLVPMLLKAVQELTEKVKSLEEKSKVSS